MIFHVVLTEPLVMFDVPENEYFVAELAIGGSAATLPDMSSISGMVNLDVADCTHFGWFWLHRTVVDMSLPLHRVHSHLAISALFLSMSLFFMLLHFTFVYCFIAFLASDHIPPAIRFMQVQLLFCYVLQAVKTLFCLLFNFHLFFLLFYN